MIGKGYGSAISNNVSSGMLIHTDSCIKHLYHFWSIFDKWKKKDFRKRVDLENKPGLKIL